MKTICIIAAFIMAWASAETTEPDTIWTIGARGECWFTPDGTKIIEYWGGCYDVIDGSVVWDYQDSSSGFSPNGYFSQDSLYFYDSDFDKYRISDGAKVATKPDFTFDTIPDFFRDSSSYWTEPRDWSNRSKLMLTDENTFYYIYYQDSLNWDDISKKAATRSLLCKYDKSLDSIVLYKPLILNGDTNILYTGSRKGYAEVVGYVSQNNTVLVRFYDDSTYRQYNATTLDSASQFIYDRDNSGWVSNPKISYNGKYLGFGTTDGESDLGWIIIYDLTNNSIYNKFLNGDSTTSDGIELIAFSRNDSCLVTYGYPMRTWNFHTGTLIHSYDEEYWAQWSLDVSPDNIKIIAPSAERTYLLRARWTPVTSVEEESEESELMLVYPNPAGDYVEINGVILSGAKIRENGEAHPVVLVYNVLGDKLMDSRLRGNDILVSSEGNVRIDISSLSPGVYFVRVGGRMYKFVKM